MNKRDLQKYRDKGYPIEINKKGEEEPTHLIRAKEKYGEIPKGFQIHHIDGDKTNNKKGNLIVIHFKDHYRMHRWGGFKIKAKEKNEKNI